MNITSFGLIFGLLRWFEAACKIVALEKKLEINVDVWFGSYHRHQVFIDIRLWKHDVNKAKL